jgi:uncharacterized OB-fold protein
VTGPLGEPFLEAARRRVLLVQVCGSCRHAQLPPMARCPACGGTDLAWTEASGRATLASFAVMHRAPPTHADRVPYVYALVALEEGPRLVSNVVNAEVAWLRIGQPLRVVFERADGDQPVPEFEPA